VSTLAPLLQAFFTDRLQRHRRVSAQTVIAYRDTFCLLLGFAPHWVGRAPADLRVSDQDVALIGDFLRHLETARQKPCAPATRGSPRFGPSFASRRCTCRIA
jgi:hypothetical protein